jgi:hypothetical protein
LRIRHLDYGEYLSISEGFFLRTSQNPDNTNLFELEPLTSNRINPIHHKYILRDSFLKLRHHQSKVWIQLKNEREMEKNDSEKTEDEITFQFLKAKNDEVWETNFLKSCVPNLKKAKKYFQTCVKIFYLNFLNNF